MKRAKQLTADHREELEEAQLLAPALIHEMRQPLTGIRAGLELVARRVGPPVTALDEWSLIANQLDRIEELFRAYQDFLHPERGQAYPFAIKPVVERALSLLQHRLRRLGPRFTFETGEAPPEGLGIPNALLHAVTNVLANALDALESSKGEPRLQVRFVVAPQLPGRVQIRVSDEGPGVAEDLRERIFEPRFTTKETGSGLGLHIARRMLQGFGGAVRLLEPSDPTRQPWALTEFSIDVPLSPRGGR